MKKFSDFLMKVLMIACLSFAIGCNDDDDDGGGGNVADPEGTIMLTMLNTSNWTRWNKPKGGEWLSFGSGSIYMTEENIFYAESNCNIASVGKVNGLGNITKIPNSGYINTTSVEPGYGYIVKMLDDDTYARLYVTEWVLSTYGGILGAKIKYQYPFEP